MHFIHLDVKALNFSHTGNIPSAALKYPNEKNLPFGIHLSEKILFLPSEYA